MIKTSFENQQCFCPSVLCRVKSNIINWVLPSFSNQSQDPSECDQITVVVMVGLFNVFCLS